MPAYILRSSLYHSSTACNYSPTLYIHKLHININVILILYDIQKNSAEFEIGVPLKAYTVEYALDRKIASSTCIAFSLSAARSWECLLIIELDLLLNSSLR